MVRATADGDADESLAFPVIDAEPQWLDIDRNRLEQMAQEDADAVEFGLVPFGRRVVHEMSPVGGMLSGRTDRYSFTRVHGDGSIVIVVRDTEPVPVRGEEEQ